MGIGDAVELVEVLEEPTPLSGAWGRVLLVVWMEMLGRRVLGLLLEEEDTGGREEDDEEGVVRSPPTTEDPLVDGV